MHPCADFPHPQLAAWKEETTKLRRKVKEKEEELRAHSSSATHDLQVEPRSGPCFRRTLLCCVSFALPRCLGVLPSRSLAHSSCRLPTSTIPIRLANDAQDNLDKAREEVKELTQQASKLKMEKDQAVSARHELEVKVQMLERQKKVRR